jgi:integrase
MSNTLTSRLDELDINIEECAQIVKRDPAEVEQWIKAKTLPGDAAVLLRFLVDDAKVRPLTFHGLRHTFAVHCARSGVPMVTLQHWMGHAETSATEIYARFAKDQN